MGAAVEWAHAGTASCDAPAALFGGRRTWTDYAFETTGYGSLELRGASVFRLTIVHPGRDDVLRDHHRQVRRGTTGPGWFRRRHEDGLDHVVDRDELVRAHADARGSWLSDVRAVARRCGTDDEVARLAGPALRDLLWSERERLHCTHVAAALAELRDATETFAAERTQHAALVARRRLAADLTAIRFEASVLAAVRQEWDAPPRRPSITRW